MSLALALDQVQRGTWWNEPTMPAKPSKKQVQQAVEDNRTALLNTIRATGRPMSIGECAEATGLTISTVGNLLKSPYKRGIATSRIIGDKRYVEVLKMEAA
jgi:DNA-binding transcriptional ArsR family regulator